MAYKLWHVFHNSFPRLSKFSLGTKIDDLFTDLLEAIYSAKYSKPEDKLHSVTLASSKLDLLKFFIQIAWETKCLDQRKFIALSVPLNDVGKQIGGWQNQAYTKQSPPIR